MDGHGFEGDYMMDDSVDTDNIVRETEHDASAPGQWTVISQAERDRTTAKQESSHSKYQLRVSDNDIVHLFRGL